MQRSQNFMVTSIERCRPTQQALAYRAHHVARNAAFHELLVERLHELWQVDVDAGQALRVSRRWQAA